MNPSWVCFHFTRPGMVVGKEVRWAMGTYEIYASEEGYRWRFLTGSGIRLCAGDQAYPTREACRRALEELRGSWTAVVVDVPGWPAREPAPEPKPVA